MEERTPIIDIHTHTFNAADVAAADYLVDGVLLGQGLGSHPTWLQGMLKSFLSYLIDDHVMRPREGALKDELANLGAIGALARFRAMTSDRGLIRDPSGGLGRSEPKDSSLFHRIVLALIDERGDFFGDGEETAKECFTNFLLHMMSYRVDNTSTLMRTFDEVDLFTPAMIDFGASEVAVELDEQRRIHEEIAKMSVRGSIPETASLEHVRVHPFFTFHPANPGGMDLLKEAVGSGFLGAKIYPSMGWSPNPEDHTIDQRDRLLEFYEYCERNGVPIKMHSGPTFFSDAEYRDANAPEKWREHVLRRFPDLRINFGHFGHGKKGSQEFSWTERIMQLMSDFAHIYADVAFARHSHGFYEAMDDFDASGGDLARVHKRLMYGSDWFMITTSPGEKDILPKSRASFGDYLAQRDVPNQDERLADYLGGNALRYLGLKEGPNRGRLQQWYETHGFSDSLPFWLK